MNSDKQTHASHVDYDMQRTNWLRETARYIYSPRCTEPHKLYILDAIDAAIMHADTEQSLMAWFDLRFPELSTAAPAPRHRTQTNAGVQLSNRVRRRNQYASIQSLWRRNQSKAASKVLDGDNDEAPHPTLEQQEAYWRPIFESTEPGHYHTPHSISDRDQDRTNELLAPITIEEVKEAKHDS